MSHTISIDGTRQWKRGGLLHRLDGPAQIYSYGRHEYWVNGEMHREDGPAVTDPDGTQMWCHHNMLHRVNGPAFIEPDGTETWYLYDKPHRVGGPAVTYGTGFQAGTQKWYHHGIIHRLDGPAITAKGPKEETFNYYHFQGKQIHQVLVDLMVSHHLPPETAVILYAAYPQHAHDLYLGDYKRVLESTGWDPTTRPTPHQLRTWEMLTKLKL